jgi:hypothetical protein
MIDLRGVDGQVRELVETQIAVIFFGPENRESILSKLELLKRDKSILVANR